MLECTHSIYPAIKNQGIGTHHLLLLEYHASSHTVILPSILQAKSLVLAALVGSAAAFAPVPNMATRSVTALNGEIEDGVRELVKSQLGVEGDFENSAAFIADLEADSLDAVELIMALEEEFDIEIPDDEVEGITTVQAAIDFVTKAKAE